MEEEQRKKLDRLKMVRRGHCSVLTKLTREIEGLVESTKPDPNRVSRLKVIYEQLDSKMKVFSNLDGEIVALCPEDEIEREIEDSESIIAKVIEGKHKIDIVIKENSRNRTHVSALPPPDEVMSRPRLPKLTLGKFRGGVTSWSTFWDSYKSAVHDNAGISVINKFNYLSSLLEGPAHRTIQGLTMNESNYDSAIKLLQDRFDKSQLIISAHMEELLKLPACTTEKSTSLRFVYDKINVNIRGLASLGFKSEQYGSLLIPIIMTELPPDLRLRFARDTDKDVWEIKELMELVKREVEARETSELVKSTSLKPPTRSPTFPQPSASALLTKGFSIKCVYCGESHYSASCSRFKTPQERKDMLLRAGRCFNCLKTNHKSRECVSNKACRHCNRKHHQSICDRMNSSASNSSNSTKSTDRESNGEATSSTQASSVAKNQRTILLQTAHALASADPHGRLLKYAYCLIVAANCHM